MFTGIVEGLGTLKKKTAKGGGLVFTLEAGFEVTDPVEGESIAVNGICLTAYNIEGSHFSVDVSPESVARSTLGKIRVGDGVNLERALRPIDRLGGHIVSGHVDCRAEVTEISREGDFTLFRFRLAEKLGRYIIEKGSITIDGISLTVNSCEGEVFGVSIIPQTMLNTTLDRLRVGSEVNIEVDVIGKYVEKLLFARNEEGAVTDGISAEFLAENGFL